MNTTQSDARQSDAFVERALARINHVKRVAQELTEALGLPERGLPRCSLRHDSCAS